MLNEARHGQRVPRVASGDDRRRIRLIWPQDRRQNHQAPDLGYRKY